MRMTTAGPGWPQQGTRRGASVELRGGAACTRAGDGRRQRNNLFVWLVADGWCWFILREKYCWLVADDWFGLREKYCWLVADKPNEQGGRWG
jgi:hypothetical protein